MNGYSNTKHLVDTDAAVYIAANAAWTYQSKNGSPVVTGSSGWFLPSYAQMSAIRGFMPRNNRYWTSTEGSTYMVAGLELGGIDYMNKTTMSLNVRACFAY